MKCSKLSSMRWPHSLPVCFTWAPTSDLTKALSALSSAVFSFDTVTCAGLTRRSKTTKHNNGAAGHILAAMITDALDHGRGTGITYRETLAGLAGSI